MVNIDNASIHNIKASRLPDLLEKLKEVPAKEKEKSMEKSTLKQMICAMEGNAINPDEFSEQY